VCFSQGIEHVCLVRGLGFGIATVLLEKGCAQHQNRIRNNRSHIQFLRHTPLEYGELSTCPWYAARVKKSRNHSLRNLWKKIKNSLFQFILSGPAKYVNRNGSEHQNINMLIGMVQNTRT
jgi:hypothetical protein